MTINDPFTDMETNLVYDCNGLELGKIIDFTFDLEFKLTSFVIKGDNEIISGEKGVHGNYFMLLPINNIRRSTHDKVFLAVVWKDLPGIADIPSNERRFQVFKNTEVFAKDGEVLGKIKDGIFHSDNYVSFVLGGSFLSSFLGKLGLANHLQMLVPHRYIERFDQNVIILNTERENLGKVLNHAVLDDDEYRMMEIRKQFSREARYLLFKESVNDALRGNESKAR